MSAEKLGARVRAFRETQEMTREELAEASGLSLASIAALEEQNSYPTIGPLQKVAHALHLRLGTFMDDVPCADPIIMRRQGQSVDLAMQGSRDKHESYRYYALAKGKTDRNMEPFFIEVLPEVQGERLFSTHQGEEFIIVHSGKLRIVYGHEEHLLEPGDSAYYNSIVPHYVGACGDAPCSIYAVFYYP